MKVTTAKAKWGSQLLMKDLLKTERRPIYHLWTPLPAENNNNKHIISV